VEPLVNTVIHGRKCGDWRITGITREALDAFRAQRKAVAGNRHLALLRAMFNWVVVDGLVAQTPFKVGSVPVVKLAREDARSRRLQLWEEIKLLAARDAGIDKRGRTWRGNPHLKALIVAALETGMRRGELLSLQWSQVGKELFLEAGKTKGPRAEGAHLDAPQSAFWDARRNDPAGEPSDQTPTCLETNWGSRTGP
jgi:integrase